MSKPKSRVRSVFDTVERAVGAPLERAATSYRFVDVMAMGIKTKRAVGGTAGRLVGGVLHKVNIATRADVQRLNGQLASLAGEVRSIEPAASPTSTIKRSAAPSPTAKTARAKTARSKTAASKSPVSQTARAKTARSKTAVSKTAAARSRTAARTAAAKPVASKTAKSSTKSGTSKSSTSTPSTMSASTRRAEG